VSGYTHHAAIDSKGLLFTWGDSHENCLGHKVKEDLLYPKVVTPFNQFKTIDVGCGLRFTVPVCTESSSMFLRCEQFLRFKENLR